jgi:hypothetical protein
MREHGLPEDPAQMRSGDVGIFGIQRILLALSAIAAVFWGITKLTVAAEISSLRNEMLQFEMRMQKDYPTANQIVTRQEWDGQLTERNRVMNELNSRDGQLSSNIIDLEKRVRELEREADREGKRK